jgi:thiol-disulfide isomerase/thioredoxin
MHKTLTAMLSVLLAGPAPWAAAQPASPGRAAAHGAQPSGEGIRWFAGDVDSAFAQARRENKPLFLFWGAVWCPPCNQVKSTVFNRQDFVERSRVFIAVYVDGDAPAAQKLGARFKVGGYPTMVLFRPDGTEVTRLPGEVDAQRYMQVLALGMNATRSVQQLVALAGKGSQSARLTAADWRLLAFYSWETDEQAVVPKAQVPATLARLAQAVPASAGDAATRLQLKALAAAASAPEKQRPAIDRAVALARVHAVLADPVTARDQFSALVYAADDITLLLTADGSAERAQLAAAWDAALVRFADDVRLSQSDRLTALVARVQLERKLAGAVDGAPLPAALVDSARGAAARADRDTTDRYERQSVISTAAYLLREAGQIDESDALLRRELARSPAPYYFMMSLGSNAKKRGDAAAALNWYQQGYETAVGPATRLQWGAAYVRNLIELAPLEAARIEGAARSIIGELEPQPETFHARNGAVLARFGRGLNDWAAAHGEERVLARLRGQMNAVCGKLPAGAPERATCERALAAANASS